MRLCPFQNTASIGPITLLCYGDCLTAKPTLPTLAAGVGSTCCCKMTPERRAGSKSQVVHAVEFNPRCSHANFQMTTSSSGFSAMW